MGSKATTSLCARPGSAYPLGATCCGGAVNFALYSMNAESVQLLLFDEPRGKPTDVVKMYGPARGIWHCLVDGIGPGQMYGFKVAGPYRPQAGLRFNPNKLLIDPYAKALSHKAVNTNNLLLGYDVTSGYRDLTMDGRDNTDSVPKAIVVDDGKFDWSGDRSPNVPLESTVLYEAHVRGFTRHSSSGCRHAGTYLGFVDKLSYLRELGVTAVELLPVHEHYVDDFLHERDLTNFWGYNTLGFFAPELSFSTQQRPGCQVEEFKTLVKEAHKQGLEIILDVVYNHTCEGNECGPTLFLKGIDNPSYYALTGSGNESGRYYSNFTGCGNSLDLSKGPALRLVMDSLRYWVEHMHVDGFRFDLASVLGREDGCYRRGATFFDVVSQDPVLCKVKLIAEPWDCQSYDVGNFPPDWSEWNGRFRDTVRRFNKGDSGQLRDLGWRLTGSADLYGDDGRTPSNSINFVTCHDGFTLHDLYSYNSKHNEANKENNNDGSSDNHSWNCGVEGETSDPSVLELRHRLARNAIAMLMFSSGTPMLLGGDEFLRTQKGNNNAYCQDNEISWVDWSLAETNKAFLDYCHDVIALPARFPVLQQRRFPTGTDHNGNLIPDVAWFGPEGGSPDWMSGEARTLCCQLDGSEGGDGGGTYLLYLILNASAVAECAKLPVLADGSAWFRVLDTALKSEPWVAAPGSEVKLVPQDHYLASPRSVILLVASR